MNGKPEDDTMPCKNCKCLPAKVYVTVTAEQSHTGKDYVKCVKIDNCIAPIIRALQRAEINMKGSCCGHGKGDGEILLHDGRKLVIKQK